MVEIDTEQSHEFTKQVEAADEAVMVQPEDAEQSRESIQ